MRRLGLIPLLPILALGLCLCSAAVASTTIDIRGTWKGMSRVGQASYPFTDVFDTENCATGTFSGHGFGGAYTWTDTGTIKGRHVNLHQVYRETAYTDDLVGTLSADGTRETGTATDSNHRSGTFADTRIGPGPSGGGCSGSKLPPPKPIHETATQIHCATTTSVDATSVCTASVGANASGAPPTGVVQFASDMGSFASGSSCTLAPVGAVESACTAAYTPPPEAVFPDISALYPGDSIDLGSTGDTTPLIDAPNDSGCSGSAAAAATSRSGGPVAHAALSSEAAHVPPSQRGLTYCVYYGGADLFHKGINGLGQGATAIVGGVVGLGVTIGGGAAGLEVGGPVGAVVGGGIGAAVTKEYVYPATVNTMNAIGAAQQKALDDPPDPHFMTIAIPRMGRVKALHSARGLRRAAALAISALARAELQAAGVGDALAVTIDRAGGALQAGSTVWQGRQTRAAIKDAATLAGMMDRLVVLQRKAAAEAARSPALRAQLVSAGVLARRLRNTIAKGFTAKQRHALAHAFGLDANGLNRLKLTLRTLDPAKMPRSAAALLGDATTIRAYQAAARALRAYVSLPGVVAASKL